MTLTLILTRHAKSSWDDPLLDDFDRPLNERGRDGAERIGRWLAEREHVPKTALVSSARRTLETWDVIVRRLPNVPILSKSERLYHASAETMMKSLKRAETSSVMMIAHNPGIADFASRFVHRPPVHDRFRDYPTAATTVMEFDAPSWKDVHWGQGRVQDFVVPRELE